MSKRQWAMGKGQWAKGNGQWAMDKGSSEALTPEGSQHLAPGETRGSGCVTSIFGLPRSVRCKGE